MPPRRSWLAAAGLVYVAAWVVGLLIDPQAPAATLPGAELVAFYQAHRLQHLAQVTLIHGVAALALVALAAALRAALGEQPRPPALADLGFGAAVAAAALSLAQAALGAALASPILLVAGEGAGIPALRALIDALDTFKLLALALMVGASVPLAWGRRALPRWLAWLGGPLVVTLVAGGLSFTLGSPTLTAALYLALPLLLVWAGGAAVALLRGDAATGRAPTTSRSARDAHA